ncbi:cytochrome P450 [Coprinopsis cinerea okayama7|uniref:Cytochrome P450 n=1 Tax=Coprinopsis cinerea (strain Okayama-7 / 130 / ATCC MYA-4618 / FGSC 9003) TaxID=240176 RepID=A8NJ10_COPC7|nr:cytochrome P450 [Coprinopsis cinerea okayama7\|eukprot:XP_001834119.2 cytochrome P450 [Coprinopsis cinerea okayama7\
MDQAVSTSSLLCACAAYILTLLVVERVRRSSRPPTPPGPKGYPIVGNILDVPSERIWEGYHKLAKRYGDMVYLEAFGQPILVLSSFKRVNDLFEKRSNIYSDRPHSTMINELMNFKGFLGLIPYGSWWKRHRRAFQQSAKPFDLPKHHPLMVKYCGKFLKDVLANPEGWSDSVRQVFSGMTVELTYGVETDSPDDPFVRDIVEVAEGFSMAALPGRWLVDTFPSLKYVPSWLPGAGFKRFAEHFKVLHERSRNESFDHVLRAMKNGTSVPCMVTSLVNAFPHPDDPRRGEEEEIARNIAAVTHAGRYFSAQGHGEPQRHSSERIRQPPAGTDTTLGSALTFYLLMALHPDIQRNAQEELDQVVGPRRLPDFEDRDKLVYCNAVLKELMRYHQDDIYDGYFIPKGTIVMANSWHILHDQELYEDPWSFKPERYIKDGKIDTAVLDASSATFGFGRRDTH